MSDPRSLPSNGRVACDSLRDIVPADEYVAGVTRQVRVPVADLLRAPDGPRDRQLLMGETVRLLETRDGWAFLQADRDGYCGYMVGSSLGDVTGVTHRVSAPATHAYERADFKSNDILSLSFGARVAVSAMEKRFAKTTLGYVPRGHLTPLFEVERSPAQIARLFLGTPYLWGGNSRRGIDCSGLVQAALLACGYDCPGDSDQQEHMLGRTVTGAYKSGDLLFWKGHVAMVADAKTLIHANAHHMSVVLEGIQQATSRIAEQGDGDITRHARL